MLARVAEANPSFNLEGEVVVDRKKVNVKYSW
jgi:hypothetical protein